MRTVRMLYGISGGRADGTDWPLAGETLEVDDGEAASLVGGRLAEYADSGAAGGLTAAAPESALQAAADYAAQPILALRDIARDRGLRITGSKAELVERLTTDDAA